MIKKIAPVRTGPDVCLYQYFDTYILLSFFSFFFVNMDMAPYHPTEEWKWVLKPLKFLGNILILVSSSVPVSVGKLCLSFPTNNTINTTKSLENCILIQADIFAYIFFYSAYIFCLFQVIGAQDWCWGKGNEKLVYWVDSTWTKMSGERENTYL